MLQLTRSFLFVPADRPRAVEKALTLPADGIIFDLEDAVAAEARDAGLQTLLPVLAKNRSGRMVAVRLAGTDQSALSMLDVIASAGHWPDAIVLPKVETLADLAAAAFALAQAPQSVAIYAMIETPRAIMALPQLAASGGRLRGLIAGTNDLTAGLKCKSTPDRWPLLPHLSMIVAAARAHNLIALDGVCNQFDDPVIVQAEAQQGADLGFDGKTLIHPAQIDPTHAAFSPSADMIAAAKDLLVVWSKAQAEGKAVAAFQGTMIEAMHAETARRILDSTADAG